MALSREEIAARYGTALFGYAQDNKVLDTVYDEMMELKKAAVANPKFISVLSDPILSSKDKKSLITAVEKDFSDEVQGFLNLLLEYNRFADEFGETGAKRLIEILDNYKGANGKKYADDNRAIRNWVVDRYKEETKHQEKGGNWIVGH